MVKLQYATRELGCPGTGEAQWHQGTNPDPLPPIWEGNVECGNPIWG